MRRKRYSKNRILMTGRWSWGLAVAGLCLAAVLFFTSGSGAKILRTSKQLIAYQETAKNDNQSEDGTKSHGAAGSNSGRAVQTASLNDSSTVPSNNSQSNSSASPLQQEQSKAPLEIKGLVSVKAIDPSIKIDLRYATTNNFTGRVVYPVNVCVLQKSTAQKLKAANEKLKQKGYGIKIYDGYRPIAVQQYFWSLVPDSRYVADPKKGGSRHNTGGAVDITLVNLEGREMEMPSSFDDFSEKASRSSVMSEKAKENVKLLTDAMVQSGFKTIETEWWHYEDSDCGKFPLLGVKLEEFLE